MNFGTVTYGKDDLGDATEKTFTYKVSESGKQPGVSNDTETKIVKVTVKDDGKGHITAERIQRRHRCLRLTIRTAPPPRNPLSPDRSRLRRLWPDVPWKLVSSALY